MAMKWCFRAGRPIADEEDSGDELHAVAGEDGVLRFAAEHSVKGLVSSARIRPARWRRSRELPRPKPAPARAKETSLRGDAAAAGVRTRMSPATRTHATGALDPRARRTWV